MALQHIVHPIPPVFDERSRVLVLGSLPSPASREVGFNYGHPRNRFWHVMAQLADEPVPATNDRKHDFCLRHHIALWDVVGECEIEGASDASIRNPKPNDLARICAHAPIQAVFCTGAKSHELYRKLGCEAALGIPAVKLPSTSPANAACRFEDLLAAYAQVFEHTCEFEPPVLGVAEVVALEQAIAAGGTSLAELMDRAGAALARRIEIALDESAGNAHVTVLCGSGNNGGDGWVAAELLVRAGRSVCVVTDRQPHEIAAQPARDAAARSLACIGELGGTVALKPSAEELRSILVRSHIVVDALLGTGFKHDSVKEPYGTWITLVNELKEGRVVIAADIASGVNAQTGAVADPCIAADETVTMIARKPGLTAPECGIVHVAPLAYLEPLL